MVEHMSLARKCENCACFEFRDDQGDGVDGCCIRFPAIVWKQYGDVCFEHRYVFPKEEVLDTDIDLLKTSPRTRRVCKNLKLKNVKDLLTVGHFYIAPNGMMDFQAIRELKFALEQIGVDW